MFVARRGEERGLTSPCRSSPYSAWCLATPVPRRVVGVEDPFLEVIAMIRPLRDYSLPLDHRMPVAFLPDGSEVGV